MKAENKLALAGIWHKNFVGFLYKRLFKTNPSGLEPLDDYNKNGDWESY